MDSRCRSYTLVIVLSVLGVSVLLAIIIGGIVYRHRWKIRYFMFLSKKQFFGYRRLPDDTLLENYKYDAFISFSDDDIKFIVNEFIPRLETDGVSLCIHHRDFLPGNSISGNIIRAIQSSRKTIVILSEAFLRSTWCMYEFNMARMESLYSREDQVFLVFVMLENVSHNKMQLEMLRWIQEKSYIEYTNDEEGQRMFWERLKLLIQ
ncbi:hypothetical protein DPMN_074468 [Dreissena polymorpha]|uniref:TIR domain-containing protein n=2 Tax=Dreissena polymorpha TaxID=45954 RepID=A0A9D4BNE6_DREPO|nr:hypothetical protein DPMN_074468 [Dreissena polymorpha]